MTANSQPTDPENSQAPELNGPAKAVLWLLSVDESIATEVIHELEDDDIQVLVETAQALSETTPEELHSVHMEFRERFERYMFYLRGSRNYLTKIATRAVGEGRMSRLLCSPDEDGEDLQGSSLQHADTEVLAPVLGRQHPQVIAAVLASLEPMRSGTLLARLPEEMRDDVVQRVALLRRVPRPVLEQAEQALAAGLPLSSRDDVEVDGVKVAATLLNQVGAETADAILEALENREDSEEAATQIRHAMFTFDDLSGLDQRGMQALLKEVQSEELVTALKTAGDEVKERIFSSVSKRAAQMLREDLEVLGPVRLGDVEAAQRSIVSVALQMQSEGKISLSSLGGDEFV